MERPRRSTSQKAQGKRPVNADDNEPAHPIALAPWPRPKKLAFDLDDVFDRTPAEIAKSSIFKNRPYNEHWDNYDSMCYNGLLRFTFEPTQILCLPTLSKLGIREDVLTLLKKIGLGHIAFTYYPLYEEYTRQCIASCQVEYADPFEPKASQATFSFKVNGIKYRIPIPRLCKLYGFKADNEEVYLPSKMENVQRFWGGIGRGVYEASSSTQSDLRHPVLRLLAKIIGLTLLCSKEVNKMRLAQLVLIYYAIGDKFDIDVGFSHRHRVNMGVIFAHHLCELKESGWKVKSKEESVGSLLTPIFRECKVDLRGDEEDKSVSFVDEDALKRMRFITFTSTDPKKRKILYTYKTNEGPQRIELPSPYTSIATCDDLAFRVDPTWREHSLRDVDRGRMPSSSRQDAPEEDTAPAPSTFTMPAESTYHDQPEFNKWVAKQFAAVWEAISSCRCRRSDAVHVPPPSPPRFTRRDRDSDVGAGTSGGSGSRPPRTRSTSPSDHI